MSLPPVGAELTLDGYTKFMKQLVNVTRGLVALTASLEGTSAQADKTGKLGDSIQEMGQPIGYRDLLACTARMPCRGE